MRVVLDTNVLFSALGFPSDSPPAKVLHLALSGKLEVTISLFILSELERNLKGKLNWDDEVVVRLRKRLKVLCGIVDPPKHLRVIKRKDADNRILECAVAAQAQVLVTGDLKDLRPLGHFCGIEILTPREFLQKYFH